MTESDRLADDLRALPGVVRVYPTRRTLGERLTRAEVGDVAIRADDGTAIVSADLGVAAESSAVEVGLAAIRLARAAADGPARARIRIVTVE